MSTIEPVELKYNSVFVFADGALTIKRSGHGKADGWATLSIPEDQIEWKDGHALVEVPPSELRELRDFLTKEFALMDDKRAGEKP